MRFRLTPRSMTFNNYKCEQHYHVWW